MMNAKKQKKRAQSRCPCGSGVRYDACCQPFHHGAPAPTPEALMRSRYTAYVLGLGPYLLASWHPDTRPDDMDLRDNPNWCRLNIVASDTKDDRGRVHFKAYYRTSAGVEALEERSEFVLQDGRWYYRSGNVC